VVKFRLVTEKQVLFSSLRPHKWSRILKDDHTSRISDQSIGGNTYIFAM